MGDNSLFAGFPLPQEVTAISLGLIKYARPSGVYSI